MTDASKKGRGPWDRAKVAHESLIRSWIRFKQWIDADTATFREFEWLVEQCERWAKAETKADKDKELLSVGDLERYEKLLVRRYLASESEWRRFHRFQRKWLSNAIPDVEGGLAPERESVRGFLDASQAKLDEDSRQRHDREVKEIRQTYGWWIGGITLVVALGLVLWIGAARTTLEFENAYFQAFAIATTTTRNFDPDTHRKPEDSLVPLKQALVAARHEIQTKKSRSHSIIVGLSSQSRNEGLSRTEIETEKYVSGYLWFILTRNLWSLAGAKTGDAPDVIQCGKQDKSVLILDSKLAVRNVGSGCVVYPKDAMETVTYFPGGSELQYDPTSSFLAVLLPPTTQSGAHSSSKDGADEEGSDRRLELYESSPDGRIEKLSSGPWNSRLPTMRAEHRPGFLEFDKSLLVVSIAPRLFGLKNIQFDKANISLCPIRIKLDQSGNPVAGNTSQCQNTNVPTGKTAPEPFSLEITESDSGSSWATLYRSIGGDSSERYDLVAFPVGREADPEKMWYLVQGSPASAPESSEKDESKPMPGWLYIPIKPKSQNSSPGYMAYPWSLESRADIAYKVLTKMGGCPASPSEELKKRYSIDYDFIKNGPMVQNLRHVEHDLCKR